MSTKLQNRMDPASCFNRADDCEPIFVLRSTDPSAYNLVIQWAAMYAQRKGGWAKMTEAQRVKFNDAMACAAEMRGWFEANDDIPF